MRVSINKKSFKSSIVSTSYLFLMLGGLFYFNHHFIGDSYIVNSIILTILMLYIIGAMMSNDGDVTFYDIDDSKINKILEIVNEKL